MSDLVYREREQSARLCEELHALRMAFSSLYRENVKLRDAIDFAADFTTPDVNTGQPIRFKDTGTYLRAISLDLTGHPPPTPPQPEKEDVK